MQERGDFQHLLENGMDFSSFLAQDQEEDEEEVVESSVVPLHPEILKMKLRRRTRNDSLLSDTQSIHSDISVMKELPSSQSQVVPEKKEESGGKKAPEETKEMRSSGSVAAHVYSDYFVAGTNWFAVIFMVVANIVCQALYSGSDIWLSHWTAEEEVKQMEVTTKLFLPFSFLFVGIQRTVSTSACGNNKLHISDR